MNRSYAVGIGFVLACAFLWASSSVLIQYIYEATKFTSPLLLTYVGTSLLAVHVPVWYLSTRLSQHSISAEYNDSDSLNLLSDGSKSEVSTVRAPIIHWQTMRSALIVAPLWFASNVLYNYSLLMTSVSSSTIISNLSSGFTLLFSWKLGLEDVTVSKLLGLCFCFIGAVLVGIQDDEDQRAQSVAGDLMALFSAIGYGLYTSLIRHLFVDEEATPIQLGLGYIGFLNAVGLLLPMLIFSIFFSNISGSFSWQGFGFVVADGVVDTVVADFCWAKAILLTSPTVATIGTSVTIPIALTTDFVLNGQIPTGLSVGGAILVIAGFILVNMDDNWICNIKRVLESPTHILINEEKNHE